MAKKASSRTSAAKAAVKAVTEAAATNLPAVVNPNPIGFHIEGGIKMDVSVTTKDITEMFAVEHEDELLIRKEALSEELAEITKNHKELQDSLEAGAQNILENHPTTDADALAASLKLFTDHDYKVSKSLSETCVKDQVVKIHVCLSNTQITDWRRESMVLNRKENVRVPFTPDMRQLVSQITEVSKQSAAKAKEIDGLNRQLRDLPRTIRRSNAAFTKAVMAGEITDGAQLVEMMNKVSAPKALPLSLAR